MDFVYQAIPHCTTLFSGVTSILWKLWLNLVQTFKLQTFVGNGQRRLHFAIQKWIVSPIFPGLVRGDKVSNIKEMCSKRFRFHSWPNFYCIFLRGQTELAVIYYNYSRNSGRFRENSRETEQGGEGNSPTDNNFVIMVVVAAYLDVMSYIFFFNFSFLFLKKEYL